MKTLEINDIVIDKDGYQGVITYDFEDNNNRYKVRKIYGLVEVAYAEDLKLFKKNEND